VSCVHSRNSWKRFKGTRDWTENALLQSVNTLLDQRAALEHSRCLCIQVEPFYRPKKVRKCTMSCVNARLHADMVVTNCCMDHTVLLSQWGTSRGQLDSWETHSRSAGKKFTVFMEPKGSLPSSQEPTTGPYPEPDESNPTSLRSTLILSSHLRPDIPSGLFPSGSPNKVLYALGWQLCFSYVLQKRVYHGYNFLYFFLH
jgi:hypothetical protein